MKIKPQMNNTISLSSESTVMCFVPCCNPGRKADLKFLFRLHVMQAQKRLAQTQTSTHRACFILLEVHSSECIVGCVTQQCVPGLHGLEKNTY